jgi:hypothetical protein
MRRLIIVVDNLRYDMVEELMLSKLEGSLFKEKALGTWTFPAVQKFCDLLGVFQGWKGILTGGGYANYLLAKSNFYCDSYTEWFNSKGIDIINFTLDRIIPESSERVIFLIHTYEVHQYFADLGFKNPREQLRYIAPEIALNAYKDRVKLVTDWIKQIENILFNDWEVIITSDHGEAFFEDGKHYHHGMKGKEKEYKEVKEVMDVPILVLRKKVENVDYIKIFTGKEL